MGFSEGKEGTGGRRAHLTTGATRAHDLRLDILFVHDVIAAAIVLEDGEHNDRDGTRVDAPGALRLGHTLHAVHAALVPQVAKRALADDLDRNFLEPAEARRVARCLGQNLALPVLVIGVARVHSRHLVDKERGLVSSDAGLELENGRKRRGRRRLEEQGRQACREDIVGLGLEDANLFLCHGPHGRVRVVQ